MVGYGVLESYPRQCHADGEVFVEVLVFEEVYVMVGVLVIVGVLESVAVITGEPEVGKNVISRQ